MQEFIQSLEIYQIAALLGGVILLIRLIIQYRSRKRTMFSVGVWSVFWLTIIMLSFAPDLISGFFAKYLGFKDNVHAVLFIGLALAFLIIFYLSSVLDRLERKLSDLVRTIAKDNVARPNAEDSSDQPTP